MRVLGEDPRRFRRQTRERIGYMPQQFVLYPDLTARENVDFVASLFGMLWRAPPAPGRARCSKLVELWDARGRRAGDLSGGMQRRLELACALVHEPGLLFLDEPTAGIDPILRADDLGRAPPPARRRAGRCSSRPSTSARRSRATRSPLIAEGRLIALGHPDELRRQAIGGDVVEVETATPFDARPAATDVPRRRARVSAAPTAVRVTVDDAGDGACPTSSLRSAGRGGEVDRPQSTGRRSTRSSRSSSSATAATPRRPRRRRRPPA